MVTVSRERGTCEKRRRGGAQVQRRGGDNSGQPRVGSRGSWSERHLAPHVACVSSSHPRTRTAATEASLMHPSTPQLNPRMVCVVRHSRLEVYSHPCCYSACLKTLPGMNIPPQRSIPEPPLLRPPSRTEVGMGCTMHLRTTPQLFTDHASRQSLSGVLSPGCSQQGSPPAAQHCEIASFEAAIPYGVLHGSYLEPGQQLEPDPCPSRRRRGR